MVIVITVLFASGSYLWKSHRNQELVPSMLMPQFRLPDDANFVTVTRLDMVVTTRDGTEFCADLAKLEQLAGLKEAHAERTLVRAFLPRLPEASAFPPPLEAPRTWREQFRRWLIPTHVRRRNDRGALYADRISWARTLAQAVAPGQEPAHVRFLWSQEQSAVRDPHAPPTLLRVGETVIDLSHDSGSRGSF